MDLKLSVDTDVPIPWDTTMTITGKGHVLVPQDRGGRKISWDGDCKGRCGEEVNKRSWHLQCYQSPVLACVKNGACLVRRRIGRIWLWRREEDGREELSA